LLLYVLTIICHVVGISHHLPPSQIHRTKQTPPPYPRDADDNNAADNIADNNTADNDTDEDANNNADNNSVMQTSDNNADATQCRQLATMQTTTLPTRQQTTA
jgi:hypothetical protein